MRKPRTDHLIDTVTLYTVETGLVTRYVAIYQQAFCSSVLIGGLLRSITTAVSLVCVSTANQSLVMGPLTLFYIITRVHTDIGS